MAETEKQSQRTSTETDNDRSGDDAGDRSDAPSPHSERAQRHAASDSTAVTEDEGGVTIIHDLVVGKIARRGAEEVGGVYRLVAQGTGQRLASMARSATGSEDRESGVTVEVGKEEAAVDVRIEVEYGTSIPQIADAIRRNIGERVESMTGLHVVEVNIEVMDLHFEEEKPRQSATAGGATEDGGSQEAARVR